MRHKRAANAPPWIEVSLRPRKAVVASGMLGLGVAFVAVPFLALFIDHLVHEVQPLSLLLNGITALFAAFGFARSGYIQWNRALKLAAVTTVAAPLGAMLAQLTEPTVIWVAYLAAVGYLAYRLFRPVNERPGQEDFRRVMILAVLTPRRGCIFAKQARMSVSSAIEISVGSIANART